MSGNVLEVPAASAGPIVHADWLELVALQSADGNSSITDLERALRRTGSVDGVGQAPTIGDIDFQGATTEAIADAAFDELGSRADAAQEGYPFEVAERHIQFRGAIDDSVYLFMLLLSSHEHEHKTVGVRGDRLFEEVALAAALEGLASNSGTTSGYLFAAPRRAKWKLGFSDAIEQLCEQMGEGGGPRQRHRIRRAQDDGLDVIVWQSFPDARPGRVIYFGQCATGKGWRSKLSDLRPNVWCGEWLMDQPPVTPTPVFFVPHRLPVDDWSSWSRSAGIIFDRCRISLCLPRAPATVAARMKKWISSHLP